MENTYWNHNGKYLAEYSELTRKDFTSRDQLKDSILIGSLAHFYYRRNNDGDATCSSAPEFNKVARQLEKQGLPNVRLNKYTTPVQLENIIDKVMEFLIPRHLKRQVTVNVTFSVVIEVPRPFTTDDIENLIRKESTVDVTIENKALNVDVVEIYDVVDVDLVNA